MTAQAEYGQPLEAEQGEECFLPSVVPEGASPANTLTLTREADFRLLVSRTEREYIYTAFSHPARGN